MWGLLIGLLLAVGMLEWGWLAGWTLVSVAAQVMVYWYGAWLSLGLVLILAYYVTLTLTTVIGTDLTRHPLGHFVFSLLRLERHFDFSVPGVIRYVLRFGLALFAARYLAQLPLQLDATDLVGVGIALMALIMAAVLGFVWRHQFRSVMPRPTPNANQQ